MLSVGPLSAQGCRLAERKVSSAHYPKTDLSKRAAPPEFYEFGRWVLGHFSGLDIDVFGAVTLAEMWREDRSPRVRLPEAWGRPDGKQVWGNLDALGAPLNVGTSVERFNSHERRQLTQDIQLLPRESRSVSRVGGERDDARAKGSACGRSSTARTDRFWH